MPVASITRPCAFTEQVAFVSGGFFGSLPAPGPSPVQLTLSILRGTPVKQDTIAVLQSQGLTGIAYVELTGGHKDSPALGAKPGEPYPVIRSGPSLYARLDTLATTLADKTTRALDSVNAVLDEDNRRALAQALADLRVVTRMLASRSATIDAALADVGRASTDAATFAAALPGLVRRIETSADAFDRMSASIAAAGTSVAAAGASAEAMIEGSRADVARFTGDALPEVRELVGELREAARSLRRASGELERDPSLLVWGRPPGRRGPGE